MHQVNEQIQSESKNIYKEVPEYQKSPKSRNHHAPSSSTQEQKQTGGKEHQKAYNHSLENNTMREQWSVNSYYKHTQRESCYH